ncbi:hypothetical protein HID58_092734 [Brassica napus]|uniref:Chlorophyll a-b binding protein, chloroplastic n=1 Tax=Brassica napus TaxID=3708 RepID=A0ABQ7XDD7_BRANA|nr:hypothetical protein HID58_092734 [Brassica napus]
METALLRFRVSFSCHPHPHHKKIAAHHRVNNEIPGGYEDEWSPKVLSRRSLLATASGLSLASSTSLAFPGEGLAVVKQGLLAGRVPGLSEPDDEGWRTYRRPDEKSGGHGVGWSPIIPYAFSVPQDWNEVWSLGSVSLFFFFFASYPFKLWMVTSRFSEKLLPPRLFLFVIVYNL